MYSETRERRKDSKRAGTNRKRSGMKRRRPSRSSYIHLTVRFPEDREGYEIIKEES